MGTLDLKPCPFCGGEAELCLRRATWFVHCKECKISGKSVEIGDSVNIFPLRMISECAEEAVNWWNRRANDENA